MEWKQTDSPVKKKCQIQLSVKKVMRTVFWEMKGPITTDLLEKGETVNSKIYTSTSKAQPKIIL